MSLAVVSRNENVRNHRFVLRRSWLPNRRGIVNFVMLNPSTADEVFDDPTVRRCVGFGKRWGFSGLVVTNLFAYRATDPAELQGLASRDLHLAIGDGNDANLVEQAQVAEVVVCAWGDHGSLMGRDTAVRQLLLGRQLFCIRKSKRGLPVHPVRERYTEEPVLL